MKILVTGGTGMVGRAFDGIDTHHEIISVGSKNFDLTDSQQVFWMYRMLKPDAVIHLAAKVGGVKGNSDYIADFFTQNILINTNVLNAAQKHGINKVVSLLSTCVYPDDVTYPLTEDQIHAGEPHASNFGYAYAKRMLDVQSRAYRQQYGCNFITAVPNNLYGPHDNFDLENGHVIPAIIRKVWEAKINNTTPVFWGDGTPLREFTHVSDIASILIYLLEEYNGGCPINIGSPNERSIRSVVELVCSNLNYEGDIYWDIDKPMGQFKKPSSNAALMEIGWSQERYIQFEDGIRETCNWFTSTYPDVRGV